MTYHDPIQPTDAERAANAIVSLRNDELMKHLSRNFHAQFDQHFNSGPGALPAESFGREYERQEMLDGRAMYATGDK